MKIRPIAAIRAVTVGTVALAGFGCASAPSETADRAPDSPSARALISAGAYAAAFDAAKSTLRDLGFLLERVDAQGGAITTKPLGSTGIAAPWEQVQSGIDQEFEDLVQRHERVVRIDFAPAGTEPGAAPEASISDDLRAHAGPIEARVSATIYRLNLDGLRINTLSIGNSTYAINTDHEARNLIYYPVAIRQDTRLAQRIARRIGGAPAPVESHPAPSQSPTDPPTAPETTPPGWTPGAPVRGS